MKVASGCCVDQVRVRVRRQSFRHFERIAQRSGSSQMRLNSEERRSHFTRLRPITTGTYFFRLSLAFALCVRACIALCGSDFSSCELISCSFRLFAQRSRLRRRIAKGSRSAPAPLVIGAPEAIDHFVRPKGPRTCRRRRRSARMQRRRWFPDAFAAAAMRICIAAAAAAAKSMAADI